MGYRNKHYEDAAAGVWHQAMSHPILHWQVVCWEEFGHRADS